MYSLGTQLTALFAPVPVLPSRKPSYLLQARPEGNFVHELRVTVSVSTTETQSQKQVYTHRPVVQHIELLDKEIWPIKKGAVTETFTASRNTFGSVLNPSY